MLGIPANFSAVLFPPTPPPHTQTGIGGSVDLSTHLCACVHSSLFVCVLKSSWMQDKPWRRRRGRRRRQRNLITVLHLWWRGEAESTAGISATLLASRKKRRHRFPARGIQSSRRRFWMCVKPALLKFDNVNEQATYNFVCMGFFSHPLLAVDDGWVQFMHRNWQSLGR